ncbi:MAG: cytidylate kinase family protein [bacterium]|nr:cytidylate kinase family protein [bacterium]
MNKKSRVILIFGFSGSGKSTLANRLGKRYGLRVIHPSGIIRDILGKKKVDINKTKYGKGFWESKKGVTLFISRLKESIPVDMIVDRILLKEIKKGNVVIDTWNMPWLTKKGIRIYLKAPLSLRAERVSRRSAISLKKAKRIVALKGEETRKLFKRLYDFDIKKDHSGVFDTIIDTSTLTVKEVFHAADTFLKSKGFKQSSGNEQTSQ